MIPIADILNECAALAEAISGYYPLDTFEDHCEAHIEPSSIRLPRTVQFESRFVMDTRKSGFAFSLGSISYVCEVFAGS